MYFTELNIVKGRIVDLFKIIKMLILVFVIYIYMCGQILINFLVPLGSVFPIIITQLRIISDYFYQYVTLRCGDTKFNITNLELFPIYEILIVKF